MKQKISDNSDKLKKNVSDVSFKERPPFFTRVCTPFKLGSSSKARKILSPLVMQPKSTTLRFRLRLAKREVVGSSPLRSAASCLTFLTFFACFIYYQPTFLFRINVYTRLFFQDYFSNVHVLIRVYTFIWFWWSSTYIHTVRIMLW